MGLHFIMRIEERSITIGQHNGNFEQRQTSYTYMGNTGMFHSKAVETKEQKPYVQYTLPQDSVFRESYEKKTNSYIFRFV
jgi:diphthamide synthase subunit DPH2